MSAVKVYLAVGVAALALASGVAAVATWDEQRRTPHQEWVSAWYCANYGVSCNDAKPWHQEWHKREPYYQYAFASMLTVASLAALGVLTRLRGTPPTIEAWTGRR